jgi:hypothetical protein
VSDTGVNAIPSGGSTEAIGIPPEPIPASSIGAVTAPYTSKLLDHLLLRDVHPAFPIRLRYRYKCAGLMYLCVWWGV